ncbi:MAG: glycosyltransferase family 2 protein, partial [Geminicoccaceae bacterium]
MSQAIEPSTSIDDRPGDQPVASPRVHAVIPVHNRLPLTLGCLEQLKRQTYRPITAIVVDGGSDDDSVPTLRREHPEVVLLTSPRPLFWAGATRLGIDWVLEKAVAQDFALLLNNDTTFGADYVEKLVDLSLRENAAVGGVNVDSRDMITPINAGVRIDWRGYGFSPCPPTASEHPFNGDVDVLNGRGVLVPLAMIKKAGNVDDAAFPHYIADYDFFCRLREAGFRLGIHRQAEIGMMVAETGLDPE